MKTFFDILNDAERRDLPFSEWKAYLQKEELTSDIVYKLDGVPQGTFYHPEFDTLRHTYQVCRAVARLNALELYEAALFHDVGKYNTTNIGNDRIYSFGHAKSSAEYMDRYADDVFTYDRNATRRIVLKHMDFDIKSKTFDNDPNLYKITYADKVLSKEMYLSDASAAELDNNKELEASIFSSQRNSKSQVIMPIGISGSGKSTYINKTYLPDVIVSPDSIRRELTGDVSNQTQNKKVWLLTAERMHDALEKYNIVVLDATNVAYFNRVNFMSQFNGHRKVALVFDVPLDVAINRVRGDIANGIDRSDVPEKAIQRQHKMFTKSMKSLKNEFNNVIYINNGI